MLPASFDNYGVDFCSLLVLPSTPTVLVIANTRGLLHHCIVMETNPSDESTEESSNQREASRHINHKIIKDRRLSILGIIKTIR